MYEFLFLAFIAFSSGFLCDLLHFCLGDPSSGTVHPKRIFSKNGRWLLNKYEEEEDRIQRKKIAMGALGELRFGLNRWKVFVCPWCLNVWLCSITVPATLFAVGIHWTGLLWLPLFWGIAHGSLGIARHCR